MQHKLKTLDFQGSPIYYIQGADGTNLVLIRPLCDLLGIHADKQIEGIKEDDILRDEHAVQRVRLPTEDRSQPYTCLPEEFIYGWLFGIKMSNTMKPETKANLTAYKRGCYHALYSHFRSRIKETLELETEQAKVKLELEAIEKRIQSKLQSDPDYQRKAELEAKQKQLKRAQTKNRAQSWQTALELVTAEQEPEVA